MSDISDHIILNTVREDKKKIQIQREKKPKKPTTETQTYRKKSEGDV